MAEHRLTGVVSIAICLEAKLVVVWATVECESEREVREWVGGACWGCEPKVSKGCESEKAESYFKDFIAEILLLFFVMSMFRKWSLLRSVRVYLYSLLTNLRF